MCNAPKKSNNSIAIHLYCSSQLHVHVCLTSEHEKLKPFIKISTENIHINKAVDMP